MQMKIRRDQFIFIIVTVWQRDCVCVCVTITTTLLCSHIQLNTPSSPCISIYFLFPFLFVSSFTELCALVSETKRSEQQKFSIFVLCCCCCLHSVFISRERQSEQKSRRSIARSQLLVLLQYECVSALKEKNKKFLLLLIKKEAPTAPETAPALAL